MTDTQGPFQPGEPNWGVAFLARSLHAHPSAAAQERILNAATRLYRKGWKLSVEDMVTGGRSGPIAYRTDAFSDVTFAGLFEAPSSSAALSGISRLEESGWSDCFTTEWTLGIREFRPVRSIDVTPTYGFVAFWEWNDAWCAASKSDRESYDQLCDQAFQADLAAGVAISGRHRADLNSNWHHFAVWDVPTFGAIAPAMADHEAVADFRFTVSRHYAGVRQPLADVLGG